MRTIIKFTQSCTVTIKADDNCMLIRNESRCELTPGKHEVECDDIVVRTDQNDMDMLMQLPIPHILYGEEYHSDNIMSRTRRAEILDIN